MNIPFETSLLQTAHTLRMNQTEAEQIFWKAIRGRRISDCRFLRQKPILSYIVDFYCSELKLAIEIDGSIHDRLKEADLLRTSDIESLGITVIRYTNNQVINELPFVLSDLKSKISNLRKLPSLE